MGTIATVTGLDTAMPGIGVAGTALSATADTAIYWSENWIKGKLSKRYNVGAPPFTVYTTTSQLTSFAERLAVGHMYKLISRGGGNTETVARGQALIDEVTESINMIAQYQCDLLDASTGSTVVSDKSGSKEVISSASAYHTTFDEDSPLNWHPDDDKLNDIDTGRS